MMQRQRMLVVGMVLVAASGCTHRGIYEGTTAWRLDGCQTLDAPDRAACEADARRSYGEYQDQRKQALEASEAER